MNTYYAESTGLTYNEGDEMPEDAVLVVVPEETAAVPPAVEPPPVEPPAEPVELPPPVFDLVAHKLVLATAIDNYVTDVCARFTRFGQEYEKREEAALAYVASKYADTPTVWITAFSDAVGVSPQVAASIILQQAGQLRGALEALGALRMAKYGIYMAPSKEAADLEKEDIFTRIAAIAKTL